MKSVREAIGDTTETFPQQPQADREQPACLWDTSGAAAAPQPFGSHPLCFSLPPLKVFIGYETCQIENSAGMFGLQNRVAVMSLCFMSLSLTSPPWQTASKRACHIGKPGNPPTHTLTQECHQPCHRIAKHSLPSLGSQTKDTRAGKVPSHPPCPHELLVLRGQTTMCHSTCIHPGTFHQCQQLVLGQVPTGPRTQGDASVAPPN